MMPATQSTLQKLSRSAQGRNEQSAAPVQDQATADAAAGTEERFPQVLRAAGEHQRGHEQDDSAHAPQLASDTVAADQGEKKNIQPADATLPAMLDLSALAINIMAANVQLRSAKSGQDEDHAKRDPAMVQAATPPLASIAFDGLPAQALQGARAGEAGAIGELRMPVALDASRRGTTSVAVDAASTSLPSQAAATLGDVAPLHASTARNAQTIEPAQEQTAPAAMQRLPASADFVQAPAAAVVASDAASTGAIKLEGVPSKWQQGLREALGERLQVQLGNNSERAVIRLDPPMLGNIEISIRHEAGALQVHMSASNNEVLRQLQTIGDSLRQDLVHRQYGEVTVAVSHSAQSRLDSDSGSRQGRDGRDERKDDTPGRALHEADQDGAAFALFKDRE